MAGRLTWSERALRLVFGVSVGAYRWGLGHYVVVALGGAVWAVAGGYVALLLVAHLPRVDGLPSGFLTTTIYIRNIEATGLFVVLGWAPLAIALNAGRDAASSLSPTMMGLLAGAGALVFRFLFLSGDNPMAEQDPVAGALPFLLALFTVIPTATIGQRIYLARRRAWEAAVERGARLHQAPSDHEDPS